MNDWCLEVWGDYACFTRPEMKVERVSYDVMTPSAARAIFESILWKPAIVWNIKKIEVLNPIRWASVRRNEVGARCVAPSTDVIRNGTQCPPVGLVADDKNVRQQRAAILLKDVRYRIYASFHFIPPEERPVGGNRRAEVWAGADERNEATGAAETPAKYAAMFERRARKGQCFNTPYLGCREFSCHFRLIDSQAASLTGPPEVPELGFPDPRDLGYMLYDMDYSNPADPKPLFFRGSIHRGVCVVDRSIVEVIG